ncbi:MAG: TraR/DksA C4-type zinc finger protein [Chloroflexi bacterium]|nr:TraR/DksA C4-type zinc finger protein [Chloroflexota bacterium]
MAKGTQTVVELRRLRRATLEEIAALNEQLQAEIEPASAPDDDSVDVAADIYERGKTLSLIQSLEDKLHNIEHAIAVASKGTYGICENCGSPIPSERLEIVPETTLCVNCANKLEQGIRRRRIQMADEESLEEEHSIDDEYEAEEEEEFEEESDDEL